MLSLTQYDEMTFHQNNDRKLWITMLSLTQYAALTYHHSNKATTGPTAVYYVLDDVQQLSYSDVNKLAT
jgi:hypothetical protein